MKYKVSVIIPIYNSEKYLNQAIDSIINQTFDFENIELILVDDCSTDNSKSIIKKYESKYENCKGIYLSKNSGLPGKPRNIGLEYATADFIVFLDSDDIYTDDGIELLYNTIIKENVDLVISSIYLNLDGKVITINNCPKKYGKFLRVNPLKNQNTFDKLSGNEFVGPCARIFKRKIIKQNKITFPEKTLCEDAYFYFKYLLNSKEIVILPENYIYTYNTHDSSTIHNHNIKLFNRFLNGMILIDKFFKENTNLSCSATINDNLASLLLIFTNTKTNHKEKKELLRKIYDFETNLNFKPNIKNLEVSILNKLILKKYFNLAIILSKIYNIFYNNVFIKKMYRIYNNKKRGSN
ncbi:glycosyltransferase family 2 protein [Methanobrevibacter sp. DSM 116169]|uniref:glycosyltransferase family 2 protein n=1 Tax=Methanobrevibacter sp. DSM 116169 TaxID=3242727 RepID=UPI0038FCF66C